MLPIDVTASDYLTRFLKHFKAVIHSHLNAVQTCLGDFSHEEKTKKIHDIALHNFEDIEGSNETGGGWELNGDRENWKTVERFCLRLNEYIEYRFSKLKLSDKVITKELNLLKCNLYKIFFDLSKDRSTQISAVTLRVSEIQNQHFFKVLRRLLYLAESQSLPPQVVSPLKEAAKVLFHKKNARLDSQQQSDKQISESRGVQSYTSENSTRLHKFSVQKTTFSKSILRPRRITLEATDSILDQSSLRMNPSKMPKQQIVSVFRSDARASLSETLIQLDGSHLQRRQSFPYQEISTKVFQGAMECQLQSQPSNPTSEELLKELLILNKKNEVLIRKFYRKARKWNSKLAVQASSSKITDCGEQENHESGPSKRPNTDGIGKSFPKKGNILPLIYKKNNRA